MEQLLAAVKPQHSGLMQNPVDDRIAVLEPLTAAEHVRIRPLHMLQVIRVYPGERLVGVHWSAARIATVDRVHPGRPRSRPAGRIPVPRSQLRDLLRFLQLGERLFALLLGPLALGDVARRDHQTLTHRRDHSVKHPRAQRRGGPRRSKLHIVSPAWRAGHSHAAIELEPLTVWELRK
jgi:hypothetical protein